MLRARKQVLDAPPELDLARDAFAGARAHRRSIEERLDAARIALETAHVVDRDTLAPAIQAKTAPYMDMSPARLRALIAQLEDELDRALFVQRAAREGFEVAKSAEVRRRTAELRPAHEAAVHRIAQVVEALSDAVDVERQIRAEVEKIGGLGSLPDGSSPIGSLRDPKSPLSEWNRRQLMNGLLR